ncbi:MAG: inorganic phosphate transporter [Pseudomonadales bacterium]
MAKPTLDKDLKRLTSLERLTRETSRGLVPLGLSCLFLVLVGLMTGSVVGLDTGWTIIVAAAVIGGYMALNIGANDVANNMAPAVGSRALHIGVAIAIAAVFETAGALIAGGDVVATVSSGIINPAAMPSPGLFVVAMISALFAAALWINLATWIGAPVSTTHSVVGGVLGGGIAMAGFGAADWGVVGRIVASWVVSPVLGGAIAAAFLGYIKLTILDAPDKLEQARRRVPLLVAVMAGAFSAYLLMKGMSRVMTIPLSVALGAGVAVWLATWVAVRPLIARQVATLRGRTTSVGDLFTVPVICGAALLSFAHGANDVANAIGPLAAIYTTITHGELRAQAVIPFWILLIGAGGITMGLMLFGPKLVRTVGSNITKLNRIRAFCVTLSAAITVIVASALGLPVSSTHIAIGALFGVGFLREYLEHRRRNGLFAGHFSAPLAAASILDPQSQEGNGYSTAAATAPTSAAAADTVADVAADADRSREKLRRRYLVRRSHLITIIAAWLITVPASAAIAAALSLLLRLLGLPGLS